MRIQINNKLKKAALFAVPLLSALGSMAQEAAPKSNSQVDMLWWLILGVMVILLFAVGILGNILVNVARVTADKAKLKAAAVIAFLFFSTVSFAQEVATTTATSAPAPAADSGDTWNMIMAIVVMTALLAAVILLALRIRRMLGDLDTPEGKKSAGPSLMDSFNASVSLDKEKDILLDHNYDGIKELDNNLPPWWVYSFYISIIWAIGYLFYYHLGGGGPSSTAEYLAEVKQGQAEVDAYISSHPKKVDENTVTMAEASGIADGKSIFATNCAVCHGNAGEGNVGPNLTDDYWIHGGKLSDLFKSVKYGWPAKGMKSWQADLNPEQIRNVVSYIKSLRGSNPANAKAPQGDLFSEDGTVASDSTSTAAPTDSSATVAK